MLKECIDVFKSALDENEDLVINEYMPKDGKYFLVTMKEPEWVLSSPIEIKYNKKNNEILGRLEKDYDYIKFLD